MTLPELLSQLDQMGHQERLQVLEHLMLALEQDSLPTSSPDETADEARWNETLAKSPEMLKRLAARARLHRDQGLNRELDPESL